MVKNPPANAGDESDTGWFDAWGGKISWRRAWQPTPIFLPGESHGQRSLVGYSPWGLRESGTTIETEHWCSLHTASIIVLPFPKCYNAESPLPQPSFFFLAAKVVITEAQRLQEGCNLSWALKLTHQAKFLEFGDEPLLKTTIGKRTFLLPLADKLFTAIQLFLFTFKRHFNCN